jgi:hypothetical protein
MMNVQIYESVSSQTPTFFQFCPLETIEKLIFGLVSGLDIEAEDEPEALPLANIQVKTM